MAACVAVGFELDLCEIDCGGLKQGLDAFWFSLGQPLVTSVAVIFGTGVNLAPLVSGVTVVGVMGDGAFSRVWVVSIFLFISFNHIHT